VVYATNVSFSYIKRKQKDDLQVMVWQKLISICG